VKQGSAVARSDDRLPYTLTRLRKVRGVSQTTIARRIGVGSPNISRLENGQDPRASSLAAYAEALGGELVHVAIFREPDGTLSKYLLQLPGDRRSTAGADFWAKRHTTPKAERATKRPMLEAAMKLREGAE